MKKQLTLFAFFVAIAPALLGQPNSTIYCWDAPPTPPANFAPMCWVGTYSDPGKLYDLNDIAGITTRLQSMPPGKRCIFLWDAHRAIATDAADHLKDSVTLQVKGFTDSIGIFHPFPNIWWDSGAANLALLHQTLFHSLSVAGAPLDMVVLDYETSVSNWSLSSFVLQPFIPVLLRDSILTELYNSIMSDARFPGLSNSLGFSDLMCVRNWWQNDSCYLIFNDYWLKERTSYLNLAIVQPLMQIYPNVRFSNYDDIHRSSAYPVPDINGHRHYKFGCTGTHTGTHQSSSFYGWLGQVCSTNPPEGMATFSFAFTPFHGLLFSANLMKSIVKSDPAPLIGWIAYPSFQEYNAVTYENNPYYFENIFHLLLSGSDDLLFWNPKAPWGPSPSDHQLQALQVSNAVSEFDSLWGYSEPDTSIFYPEDSITSWTSHFVLTGRSSDSLTVWRFTPELDSLHTQPLDYLTSISPLTFDVNGSVVSFPPGAVVSSTNSVSTAGLWIIAPCINTVTVEIGRSTISVIVFPNPTNHMLHLYTNRSSDYFLEIKDATGRTLESRRFYGDGCTVDLSDFSQGVYFLTLAGERIMTVVKAVKE